MRHFHVHSPGSTHMLEVVLHRTVKGMRAYLRKGGEKNCSNAEAVCISLNRPAVNGVLAQIHFNLEKLTVHHICHECVHAAWQRAEVLGIPKDTNDFEEQVATDAGDFVKTILAWLEKHHIRYTTP